MNRNNFHNPDLVQTISTKQDNKFDLIINSFIFGQVNKKLTVLFFLHWIL